MTVSRPSIVRWITIPAVVALLAPPAGATPATRAPAATAPIERALFTWSGRVDREVFITVRGRDVQTFGEAFAGPRSRVHEALPRTAGYLLVERTDGRGDIAVIEQPSVRNGYQAAIRIRDPRAGADRYQLIAWWQGDGRSRDDRDRGDRDRGDRYEPRRGNSRGSGRGGRDDARGDRGRWGDDIARHR